MENMLKEKNVKKMLIIADAEQSFVSGTMNYFSTLGIDCRSLTLSKSNKKEVEQLLNEASVIYLSGGNPYPLAKEIKNYRELISTKVFSTVDIVIGASAGVMVLGEEIYLAELLEPGSANGFTEEDNEGLDFLNGKVFFPHCDEFPFPKEYEGNKNLIYIDKEDFFLL
jgi:peptidase E